MKNTDEFNSKGSLFDSDAQELDIDEEDDKTNELTAYDMAVFYNTYNLSTLLKWWDNKLIVPQFQRGYVWSQKKASEFVDSILRGLPVPAMFFYADSESRFLVIDGQQRLTTLFNYINVGKYAGKEFKLTGSIHPKWDGCSYNELEQDERDRLDDALMNVTVMRQLSPDDEQSSMYLAFSRINTGGVSLTAQEIRMAVSYGPLAEYIDKLSRDKRIEKFGFLRTKKEKEFGNYRSTHEFLLKFFAFFFERDNLSGASSRVMLDKFFSRNRYFDNPQRRKKGEIYRSKEEFDRVYEAAIDDITNLSSEDLSPYSKPTQSFLEAVWIGLTYRRLVLGKNDSMNGISDHIKKWKDTIGEERFSELFQARRSSSMTSVKDRVLSAIDYFSKEF